MGNKIVTFGEIMGRLAPEGFLRFRQAVPGFLGITFGGAEGNVAASIALLGKQAVYVTALPKHALADACVANLRAMGIDTSRIIRTDEGRLGLFFLETGANQRPSNVIYDRADSSICLTLQRGLLVPRIRDNACDIEEGRRGNFGCGKRGKNRAIDCFLRS
jgi:2-dehydro-3-deoxygluconokinase